MTEQPSTPTRRQLRRQLRDRRRRISPQQQSRAARRLTRQIKACPAVQNARSVALYWPNDGEIDPRPFRSVAQRRGKNCYLPVLHPVYGNRLWFFEFADRTQLKPNRFGIPEPRTRNARAMPPWALDVVLMPLVGFTAEGDRLGMGGGFYDRTFAFLNGPACHRPRLIGLAHECQRVDAMPTESWDIPMDYIITDGAVYQPGG